MTRTLVPLLFLASIASCLSADDDAPVDDSALDGGDDLIVMDERALPQFHGRFGSPSIVRDGDALHAYFAIQAFEGETVHVAHARSDDNGKTWLRVGDALPRLNARAKPNGSVWAPGVAKISDDRWMLYYTATEVGTERHMCIYRAHADSPRGPFVDDYDGPLVCPDGGLWAIDPYPVRDAGGTWHLLARVDKPDGVNTTSIRELGPQGGQFAPGSAWRQLTRITKGGWEEPVMENAGIVRLGAPGAKRWFVFYSGGSYRDNSYAVGYADCGSGIDNGACEKKTVAAPWLASRPALDMYGPGTPTFWKSPAGDVMMAVNTWEFSGGQDNPQNRGQIMHIFKVALGANGKPVATFVRKVE